MANRDPFLFLFQNLLERNMFLKNKSIGWYFWQTRKASFLGLLTGAALKSKLPKPFTTSKSKICSYLNTHTYTHNQKIITSRPLSPPLYGFPYFTSGVHGVFISDFLARSRAAESFSKCCFSLQAGGHVSALMLLMASETNQLGCCCILGCRDMIAYRQESIYTHTHAHSGADRKQCLVPAFPMTHL